MNFHNDLAAAGYVLLDKADSRCLGEFCTWEKGGTRIALYPESLRLHGSNVLRQPAAGNEVTLHGIIVDLRARLQGKADAAMRLLLDAADRHRVTIYIEPAPLVRGGMNRSQLVAFYGKRGFVGTDASNAVMRRLPGARQGNRSEIGAAADAAARWVCGNEPGRVPGWAA